jgi:hypothetical protein
VLHVGIEAKNHMVLFIKSYLTTLT